MWRRIEIRNFRSIEFAEITLGPFAVIVGPNGSGKSNFADALVFARDIAVDAELAIDRRGGISSVRRWGRTRPCDVSVDIRASNTAEGLESDYVRHSFIIKSAQEGKWNFHRETIEELSKNKKTFSLSRSGQSISTPNSSGHFPKIRDTASAMLFSRQMMRFRSSHALQRVRRFRLNPDAMRQPQLSTENWLLNESGSNIATALRHTSEFRKTVSEVMRKVVPGLQDIDTEQVGRYLIVKFTQLQSGRQIAEFAADEMSEGALRALGIIVAAYQMKRDELLIIEEPEVSIHTGAAALLFDVLKVASRRGAVLITTHSADILEAAKEEEILVCDYGSGITHIGPLATQQKEIVRKGLFSLAELVRSEPLRIEGDTQKTIESTEDSH